MSLLEVSSLTVQYGSYTVLHNVSFSVEENQWLMIIGPNGAGKSTIVHAISRGVPYRGTILFQGKNIQSFRPSKLARLIGILAQNRSVNYAFSVREVVRLGRYAYSQNIFESDEEREQQVEHALAMTGMTRLADQSILELSGGEIQRTFLAQLFAQNPRILVLDEPTNHLDLVYQKQIFSLIREWVKESGRAVISVVHDLSLARAYGSHGLLLNQGERIAFGEAEHVFAREYLEEAYSMDVYAWMRRMLGQWETRTEE